MSIVVLRVIVMYYYQSLVVFQTIDNQMVWRRCRKGVLESLTLGCQVADSSASSQRLDTALSAPLPAMSDVFISGGRSQGEAGYYSHHNFNEASAFSIQKLFLPSPPLRL